MNRRFPTLPHALLQVCLWGIYGFLFSFAQRYFIESLGLSSTTAGLILALATVLAFALQPLLTAATDRRILSVRAVLLLCAGAVTVLCPTLLLPLPTAVGAAVYGLACTALQVLPSFVNALSMSGNSGVNFGVARGCGSIAFGLTGQLAIVGIRRMGLAAVPLCSAVLAAGLCAVTIRFSSGNGTAVRQTEAATPIRTFVREQPRFCLLLVGSTLLYIGHNLLCNYMYQIAVFKGDADAQGTTQLIAALLELPTMFLFARLLKLARSNFWLILAGGFMTLRVVLVLILPGVTGLYIAQLAQMLGFALYAVCSVCYVDAVIPAKDAVKGQTYLGATNTLGSLLSNLLGGAVVDAGGVSLLLTLCVAASALGAVLVFAAAKTRRNSAAMPCA